MEPLADAVGLRGHRLCFRVFYIVYCQIKLIIMLLYFATILCAPVGQYSLHWQVMRLIKWQYTIIQQASRCNRILVTYNLQ